MHAVIFEGQLWNRFLPLSLSRPVFSLATGMTTLLAKQIRHLKPDRLTLWVRPEFETYCRDRIAPKLDLPVAVNQPLDDQPALICSGRTLHLQLFEYPNEPAVDLDDEKFVRTAFAICPGLSPSDVLNRTDKWMKLLELPQMMQQTRMAQSLWDLVSWNEESLIEDSTRFRGKPAAKPAGPFHLVNPDEIWIGDGVTLKPGVVLDASKGPIVLDEHVTVGANSVIEGPCFLGPYVRVSPLSNIKGGCSVGMMSRVGGEVANSVILGYSNKAHHGFLGDSYVGKWVNLGAGTTTSNLKNTYGEITAHLGERALPTGRRFLGSMIGDHAKTAINTTLVAGSYVGFSGMVACDGFIPAFTPSYTYCTDDTREPYRLDKAIEVAQRVFARRDRAWTDADEQIMRYVARTAPQVEK